MSWLETAGDKEKMDAGANLGQALKVGEANLKVMALLDKGHTARFGAPTPGEAQITPKAGKVCLV